MKLLLPAALALLAIVTSAEEVCECPPDTSAELKATLAAECDSKLKIFQNDSASLQKDLESTKAASALKITELTETISSLEARLESEQENCSARLTTCDEDKSNIESGHNARIQAIQKEEAQKVTEIQGEIAVLIEAHEGKDQQILTLQGEKSTLVEKLTALEAKFATLQDDSHQKVIKLESEKTALNEALVVEQAKISKLNLDLSDSESRFNEAAQKLTSIRNEKDSLETKHSKKVNNLNGEITSLKTEVEKLQKQRKMYQDQYYDAKDEIKDLDSELRYMHDQAQSTYINATLIQQDVMNIASRNLEHVQERVEQKVVEIRRSPSAKAAEAKIAEVTIEINEKITIAQAYLTPRNKEVQDTITATKVWRQQGRAVVKQISDIWTSTTLTVESALKEIATLGLDYLDLTKEGIKERSQIREETIKTLRFIKNNTKKVASYLYKLILFFLLKNPVFRLLKFILSLPFMPLILLMRTFKIRVSSSVDENAMEPDAEKKSPSPTKKSRKKTRAQVH